MEILPLNKIQGFERFNDYGITKTGDVWSIKNKDKPLKLTPFLINGYKCVNLRGKYKRKCALVGNLVAHAFVPKKTKSVRIYFKDGNKENCNVDNIDWFVASKETRQRLKRKILKVRTRSGIHEIVKEVVETYTETVDIKPEARFEINPDILKKFNSMYEAMRIKGYTVPSSNEFINQFLNEAMDNYISQKGLRRHIYLIENNLST